MTAERIVDAAAERPAGKGKGDDEKQADNAAQRPGIAFRNTGLRQAALQILDALGHALAMFVPQRLSKRINALVDEFFRLDGDRLVIERVDAFQPLADFRVIGQTESQQEIEAEGQRESKKPEQCQSQCIRNYPEDTEPGQAQENGNGKQQRQYKRPQAFEHNGQPCRQTEAIDTFENIEPVPDRVPFVGLLIGHPHSISPASTVPAS